MKNKTSTIIAALLLLTVLCIPLLYSCDRSGNSAAYQDRMVRGIVNGIVEYCQS